MLPFLHPFLLESKSWWTALTSTVFLATPQPSPLFRRWGIDEGSEVASVASWWWAGGRSVCLQFRASLLRLLTQWSAKSACLARPTWLSRNDHEFGAKSQTALTSFHNWSKPLLAGRSAWEMLLPWLTIVEIIATIHKLVRARLLWL